MTPGEPDRGPEARLGWLVDLEELRRLPQRYARAVDARDHDSVAALFWPDGHVEGLRGAADVLSYLDTMASTPLAYEASMHVLGEPLIELAPGASIASLDTYGVVYQRGAVAPPHGDATLGMRYLDEVERRGTEWRIRRRRTLLVWRADR